MVDDAGHAAACLRSHEVATTDAALLYGTSRMLPSFERPDRRREPVVRVSGLVAQYPVRAGGLLRRRVGTIRAVDDISFDLRAGEILGLVGESGCGKTTTLMQILALGAPIGGRVEVLGRDTAALRRPERHRLRRDLQVVFQDPAVAVDPRWPVFATIAEPLRAHGMTGEQARARVAELLVLVGLGTELADRFPSELSGGQRQRVCIARALAPEPRVLLLDEPVSMLDVSVRAGVVNLLDELRHRLGLAAVFVSHDLAVVRHIADRVAVMYLGRLVETGGVDEVFGAPRHPYTHALLSAIPIPDPTVERARRRIVLAGEQPGSTRPTGGCAFRPRCPLFSVLPPDRRRRCVETEPARTPLGSGVDHDVACHYPSVTSA